MCHYGRKFVRIGYKAHTNPNPKDPMYSRHPIPPLCLPPFATSFFTSRRRTTTIEPSTTEVAITNLPLPLSQVLCLHELSLEEPRQLKSDVRAGIAAVPSQ